MVEEENGLLPQRWSTVPTSFFRGIGCKYQITKGIRRPGVEKTPYLFMKDVNVTFFVCGVTGADIIVIFKLRRANFKMCVMLIYWTGIPFCETNVEIDGNA